MEKPLPPEVPQCPRCGYDQSGVAASWTDSCPLGGVCSECGLELDWRTVMRPDLVRCRGLYEHAHRPWNLGWAWRTWSWTMRPWVFERRVKLEHRPRILRLLLWLPLLILPLHILVALSRSIGWIIWTQARGAWMAGGPSNGNTQAWDGWRHLALWTTPVGHLQDGPWAASNWFEGWYISMKSSPLFLWVGLAIMLSVPATLLLLTSTLKQSKVRPSHILRCTVYGLAWTPLIFLVTAVNALHTLFLIIFLRGAGTGIWTNSPITRDVFVRHAVPWLIAVVLWSMIWWWYAVVRVLKLHQGRFVWVMMMIVGLLVGFMMALFAGPAWLSRWLA